MDDSDGCHEAKGQEAGGSGVFSRDAVGCEEDVLAKDDAVASCKA